MLGSEKIKKAFNTNLLNKMIEVFENSIHDETNPLKWYMVSAHDGNIINLATALNLTSYNCIGDIILFNKTE
jgi:hypothetical protein